MTVKLPPHVARELARHVKPARTTKTTTTTRTTFAREQPRKHSQSAVFLGTITFLGISFSIPFLTTKWVGRLTDKETALTPAQIRRGAFNNSGSKDVGRDPKWDFEKGVYKKDEDFRDLFARDNPNQIDHGEQFLRSSRR